MLGCLSRWSFGWLGRVDVIFSQGLVIKVPA